MLQSRIFEKTVFICDHFIPTHIYVKGKWYKRRYLQIVSDWWGGESTCPQKRISKILWQYWIQRHLTRMWNWSRERENIVKISDTKCWTSKIEWWWKYLYFQNYYTRRVPAEIIPILKVQQPEVIEWVGDSMVVIVLLCLVAWIPTPPRSVSINKMKSEN